METRSTPPIPTSLGIQTTLTINGTTNRPWRKSEMRAGDVLLLSRPLGTGVLFAGAMAEAAEPRDLDQALAKMSQSQHGLLKDLYKLGLSVHACTDITGFGLLGHLGEMLDNKPELTVELDNEAIPIYDGVLKLIEQGITSSIAPFNRHRWQLLDTQVLTKSPLSKSMMEVLVDPQTNGPLLIACDANAAKTLTSQEQWKPIGAIQTRNL